MTVDFTPGAYERLVRLKDSTSVSTTSGVLRKALKFYLWAIEQQNEGFKVRAVKEAEGRTVIKEIDLFEE